MSTASEIIARLLGDDSDEYGAKRYAQAASMAASRGRGGSSYSLPLVGQKDALGMSSPVADPAYIGQAQAQSEAGDDGTNAPVAARQYTSGYMDNPEWRAADKEEADIVNEMKKGAAWNWATNGQHFRALNDRLNAASYRKSGIERRLRDEATIRYANTERFNWAKPDESDVYNPDTGTYYDRHVGTFGTEKRRAVDRPTLAATDEHGGSVTATRGPANIGWVTRGVTPQAESRYFDADSNPLATGEASVEPTLNVLRDPDVMNKNAKAAAEIEEKARQAEKHSADTAKVIAETKIVGENVPAGSTRVLASGKTFTAPLTPAQKGERQSMSRPMSTKDIVDQARKNAMAAVPKPQIAKWDTAAQEKMDAWQEEYDSAFARYLSEIQRLASGATPVSAAEPENNYGSVDSERKSTERVVVLGKDAGGYKKGTSVRVRTYEDGSVDILGVAGK